MAMFVHLAPEKESGAIRRGGIKSSRGQSPRGVYALPVTENFYVSHQWLRELKRGGQRTFVGVYFRIPDDEPVLVGHYNNEHQPCLAAEAVGFVRRLEQAEGFEVVVPRKILASEVHKVRNLPQVLGWRFRPDAHGTKPCGCPACQPRGEIKSKRLREAYEAAFGSD